MALAKVTPVAPSDAALPSLPFPIVGIGASAGGLEALTQLLSHLVPNTGMAFVIVQHLDPHRQSALAELLDRIANMPVREVAGRTTLQPNCVYVIPPGSDISFSKGALTLRARPNSRAPHLSIDFLFESLALDQRERAIGVILSGSGTDGTLGLEAIKAEGGITFAQDDTAKFDSMPRSAIAAGCVDFVLSPEKIAKELSRIAKHPYVQGTSRKALMVSGTRLPKTGASGRVKTGTASDYEKILLLLQNRCRTDFTLYKPNTIQRRIARRMVLGKFESAVNYVHFLERNPKEIDALFGDLLIGVTGFFRNREAFETLKKKALPRIFERKRDDPIRVWTLGCSSGQEAYSVAMLLIEYGESISAGSIPIQVYATDLNEAALNKARQGLYPKNLLAEVSPERLQRFFVEEHGGYRVNKMLREICVFARHNLLTDPPFSRMDLISCRNLLIYLEPELQKQFLPSFHYALKPAGFLFLGASESVGSFTALFEPVDKKEKIYARKVTDTPPHRVRLLPRPITAKISSDARPAVARAGLPLEILAQREADRITLKQYAPPGVLINDRLQVLQFRGATGHYLEPASGKANFHVLQMAREGLMLPLRAAINEARKDKRRVVRKNIRVGENGNSRTCSIEITPLLKLAGTCYLITFQEARHHRLDTPESIPSSDSRGNTGAASKAALLREMRHTADLERELSETRDYLQSLQDQHEASNEEIQASNEEGQSANEELQSINEELETSKEELESSNEELITLNEEMVTRNADLNRLNSDLNNLHLSINTAILVLGRDLKIRRFTPAAEKAFNLVPTDLGRPISGIRSGLNFRELEAFVLDVIDAVALREREVQDNAGKWYLLRVRPYLTLDNEVDGAVLVLIDIDTLKQSEHALVRARDTSDAILRTARDSLIVLDANLHVTQANEAFYSLFQLKPQAAEGSSLLKLGSRQWDIPRLHARLTRLVGANEPFSDLQASVAVPGLGQRSFLLHGRRMLGADHDAARYFLLSMEDVTERQKAREALRVSETRFRRLFEAAQDGILLIDPTTRKIIDANPYMTELLGHTHAELLGLELLEIGLLANPAASETAFRKLRTHGSVRYDDLPFTSKRGEPREVEFVSNLYVEDGVEIVQCNIRDITARKRAEAIVREQEELIFALIEQSPAGTYVIDAEFCLVQVNPVAMRTLKTIDPLLGRDFAEIARLLWPEPTASEIVQRFRDTMRTGQTYVAADFTGVREGGAGIEAYEWQIQRITKSDGRHCVVCYFNDITLRKHNEAKLATQARWADLLSKVSAQLILTAAPNTSLSTIMKWMVTELGGGVALYYSVTPDGRRMKLENDVGLATAHREQLAELRVYEGMGSALMEIEEQVKLAEFADNPHPDFQVLRAMGAKAYLTHPLRTGATLHGILIIIALNHSCFEPHEVKFIHTVCDLSAATEERIRLLKDTAKARDAAQAANQAKDDFLGAVSHELRTPLNPVLLVASERAEDRGLPQDVRDDFSIIARNVALEARLIDDLLDLTRAAHAKLALQLEVVDVHAILADAIAVVQPELSQKQIKLSVTSRSSNSLVQGDALRLQQVFWNVLRNAVKFTPVGGTIQVLTESPPKLHRLHVSVTDSGIGMTFDELGRVFERFTQGDHAKPGGSLRFGGLGLGLSISRTLIEAHGGTIEASSAGRDLGTTFLIDVPVVAGANAVLVPATKSPFVATSATKPTRPRLLMVEDHDETRFALSNLLVRRGYTVTPAVSVGQARSLALQQTFDVMVCDIGLPDGTGYELMSELKKLGTLKGIALTGYGSESDIARSFAAGFDSHVTKPVSIQALTKALAALEGR